MKVHKKLIAILSTIIVLVGIAFLPITRNVVAGITRIWGGEDLGWEISTSKYLLPITDLTYNLGSTSYRILGMYARDVYLGNAAAPKSYGERIYKRVYNRTGKTLTNGEVVCYYTASTVTIGGFGVDIETAPNTTAGAGQDLETIAGVIAETISPSSYGYMQVWGVHTAIKANYSALTVPTVNYRIVTSTRSGFACASFTSTTNIGMWLQTTTAKTSTGTAIGFIKALSQ